MLIILFILFQIFFYYINTFFPVCILLNYMILNNFLCKQIKKFKLEIPKITPAQIIMLSSHGTKKKSFSKYFYTLIRRNLLILHYQFLHKSKGIYGRTKTWMVIPLDLANYSLYDHKYFRYLRIHLFPFF